MPSIIYLTPALSIAQFATKTAATVHHSAASCLLYADHVERTGVEFFRRVCEQDLEGGVVAKLAHGAYGERWYKIRNPNYTQYKGRHELFDRRHPALGASVVGQVF